MEFLSQKKKQRPGYLSRLLLLCLACLSLGCPKSTEVLGESGSANAPSQWLTEDLVYDSNIKTVQFYRNPFEGSYPVLKLNGSSQLVLEFDEWISQDLRETDFTVDIINCDADWRQTYVLPIEFYEGFVQDRITEWERSEFTKVDYVHYRYAFPQENERFKMSGNYLLKVYRNNNPNQVVLTRRFIVANPRQPITSTYQLQKRVERLRLSELGFQVNTSGLNVFNPARDLKVMLLQNFRWDNAMHLQQARFFRDNKLEYLINLNTAFNGGNEFRILDIRSTRFHSIGMQEVEENESNYTVFLYPDKARLNNTFSAIMDRNGSFIVGVQEWPNEDYQADYLSNIFTLQASEPYPNAEVYLFGRFTDWQCQPEYKLSYRPELERYEADVSLKQGIYDYAYVIKRPGSLPVDEQSLEGQRLDNENFYTVLVYFKGPTDRTHQLIGYQPFNYFD
ncbi:MAG: DUF5103 domain-containing protein [Bacteroidota bacterium]